MNYLHVFYSNKGKYFDFIKKYKKESNCIKFYCIEDAINDSDAQKTKENNGVCRKMRLQN